MKIKGQITSIQGPTTFENGSKKLTFQIDTREEYNNIISFEYFKGSEHADKIDNFIQYNHVGDNVEVEFNIKCHEYNGKWYTNLSVWKVDKQSAPAPTAESFVGDADDDGLPF